MVDLGKVWCMRSLPYPEVVLIHNTKVMTHNATVTNNTTFSQCHDRYCNGNHNHNGDRDFVSCHDPMQTQHKAWKHWQVATSGTCSSNWQHVIFLPCLSIIGYNVIQMFGDLYVEGWWIFVFYKMVILSPIIQQQKIQCSPTEMEFGEGRMYGVLTLILLGCF